MGRTIAVHGLGYVGLTAAVHFARAGVQVIGYDPDAATAAGVNGGKPRAGEFLSYLNSSVADLVANGRLRATTRFEDVQGLQVHIVAVPTERSGLPDDRVVLEVLRRLFALTPDRTLVVVESTLTPGTIDRLLAWSQALVMHPQRQVGADWFLAVCPRRDWFADADRNLHTLPRIVGGVTDECTRRATMLLSMVSKTILTTDYRTAEVCKALENALLHVPLMFAYQLAWAMPGHDIAEALRLAGTHWRLTPLYLGFGAGGRCVPLGTQYLTAASRGRLELGEQALNWDSRFRQIVAGAAAARLTPQAKVLILGIAYRPEFRDAGLSPGLDVANALAERGFQVWVHDPMWDKRELQQLTGLPVADLGFDPRQCEGVLLATPHKMYLDWPADPQRWRKGQYVLDGQGAWDIPEYRALFEKYGVRYVRVGKPGWLRVLEEATV